MNKKDFFWKLGYLVAAGAVFLIDQATKAWAVRRLRFGGDREIIPGFLEFRLRAKYGRGVFDARRSRRYGTLGFVSCRVYRGRLWFYIFSGKLRVPMTGFWAHSHCF